MKVNMRYFYTSITTFKAEIEDFTKKCATKNIIT